MQIFPFLNTMNPTQHEVFFAPCPRGLERLLAQELRDLGGQESHETPGGVECRGSFALCYRLNRESRLASRILWRVGAGTCHTEEDLYRLTFEQPWAERFSVHSFIKVRIVAQRSPLKSLEFATLRVKDGICDRFVEVCGARPTIDKRHPDISVVVYLAGQEAVWYIDTSGAPLFKRGWRKAAGEAPIRENLAAGILELAGWTPDQVLLDPMCGAGTFLIEAGLKGKGIPAGNGRSFAFTVLSNFDGNTWSHLRQKGGKPPVSGPPLSLYGYDQNVQALDMARMNSRGLGFSEIHWKQEEALDVEPPAPHGLIVTNPPYGVRMGDHQELEEWYPKFGNMLKQRFAGWKAYIFTADLRVPKLIRLAPSRKIPLYNGPLESRLYEFRMVAGGNRKQSRLVKRTGKEMAG
ncbi:MAG: class I SAM-dependent RNA methyltransferase [Nitrospirales bacterium]